ncbi:MAG: adenylyltransferase/cytidyltransferase family protein [Nanoarchaeota archaeon]
MGQYIPFERIGELEKKIRNEKEKGKILVMTGGTFDLLHIGHAYFLENCKKYGDILVVNVVNTGRVKFHKRDDVIPRPVHADEYRASMVAKLDSVDYATIHPEHGKSPTIELAILLKPHILVRGEDGWTREGSKEVRDYLGYNVKLKVVRRVQDISSTRLFSSLRINESYALY